MAKNLTREGIVAFMRLGYRVRVWIPLEDRTAANKTREELRLYIEFLQQRHFGNLVALAEELAERHDIAAVEVTDEHGMGVVIYVDWP